MYKDVSRRPRVKARVASPSRPARLSVLLLIAFVFPMTQTAYAVAIYYARAIGQDFLPEPTAPEPVPQPTPPQPTRAADLPGLGTPADMNRPSGGMSTWTKVLIGVAVVGAIAALSNSGGGGSGEATVSTDGAPNTGGATSPPPSTGGSTPPSNGSPTTPAPPSVPSPVPTPIAAPPVPPTVGGGERERDDKGKNRGRK